MSVETQRFYCFGGFRVDSEKRLLFNGENRVQLAPKALDTLLVLVENHERIVEKGELMKLVWPDSTVEENNLNQAISALRKALGEDPTQHRYIVTMPGRGYRFVAHITGGSGSGDGSEGASVQVPRRGSGWQRRVLVGTVAFVLLIAFAVTYLTLRNHRMRMNVEAPAIRSLAVLPLENLSHNSAEEYFAEGMTDELITQLGQVAVLRVISRTSANAVTAELTRLYRRLLEN